MHTFRTVDEILETLQARRVRVTNDQPFVEAIDHLAHGLQYAYNVSLSDPDDLELQAAALVHDIGHILEPVAEATHGVRGAEAVRPLLGSRVARLVELHVPAKRYLVVKEPLYVTGLSDTSLYTLVGQGGRMTAEECDEFESDPDAAAAVALRRADEAAKVRGREVPGLDAWREVLLALTPEQVAQ